MLDLRKELKKAGLDSKGNKAVLVERLKGHVETAGSGGADTNGNGETVKEEEKKVEPTVAAEVPVEKEVPEKAAEKDGEGATEKPVDTAEDNPLSEERMKKRAQRFGLPWPREEGAKRPKLSAVAKKNKAISAFELTSE